MSYHNPQPLADTLPNLFIVFTPFQLLSAKEFIFAKKLKRNHLVIVQRQPHTDHFSRTKAMVEESEWEKIHYCPKISPRLLENYKKLAKSLKPYRFRYVATGHYEFDEQILMANIHAKVHYLIDDGTHTLVRYRELRQSHFKRQLKETVKKLFTLRYGMQPFSLKPIHFFCFFPLEKFGRHRVAHHDFPALRQKFAQKRKKVGNRVYFIGQNYVENHILSRENYHQALQKVLNRYPTADIFYLPHLAESAENLALIQQKFPRLHIVENKKPAEMFFLALDEKPLAVVGIYSTLLFSLKYLLPDSALFCLRLEKIKLHKDWVDRLGVIDEAISALNIPPLPIK